jgi:outer membrane protein TolC
MRYLFLSVAMLGATLGIAQDKTGFTLAESIQYALENNEQVRIANIETEISSAVVGETRSQGLPQVNVNGAINYNYQIQRSLIDLSTFDPNVPEGTEAEVAFGQTYDGNVAIGARQLIFDGSYFVGLQAAKTYRELSAKQLDRTKIDINEAVSKAYFTVLINRENLEVIEKNYKRLDTLLYETRAMYENGFAEKIDVDRLQVTLNNLKVNLDRTRRLNDVSLKLLKFQMGYPLDQEIKLLDKLENVNLDVPIIPEDFNYNDRIEFSQVNTNQNLARLDLKNNRVQRLPKIYANFNYGYNTATSLSEQWFQTDRWLNFGAVGLTVSMPIFDGLRKTYKIQQNQLQIDQLELQKSMLKRNIDIEIEQSTVQLNAALQALEVQNENMELAREVFEITKTKYQEGVGSNLEVIEADSDLKEAQTNYYSALYEAILAKIELQKAIGRLNQ